MRIDSACRQQYKTISSLILHIFVFDKFNISVIFLILKDIIDAWRGVGVAYRAGFENQCALLRYRGFESRPLRSFGWDENTPATTVAARGFDKSEALPVQQNPALSVFYYFAGFQNVKRKASLMT